MFYVFILLIIGSGSLHIWADKTERWSLTYLFKPLTILLIIGLLISFSNINSNYGQWILIGLVLSLIGDVFLMLRPQKFIAGLASFLMAHICYVIAFSSKVEFAGISYLSFWVVPIGLFYFNYLRPKLGKLTWPVLAYFTAISLMLVMATSLYLQQASTANLLLLVGTSLFAISDGILGYRKFVADFSLAQPLIMISYYKAQLLIAISVFWPSS